MGYENAEACWSKLTPKRDKVLRRVEDYAALTIASVYRNDDYEPEDDDKSNDYQSLGAVAVNHLVNKLALAMFAPSRPFFRVTADLKTQQQLQAMQVPDDKIVDAMSAVERTAIEYLDQNAQRPHLYRMLRHVVVAGNVLLDLTGDSMRVMGLKYFCVKRTARGVIHKLVIKEEVLFDELEESIQAVLATRYKEGDNVCFYKYIDLKAGKYTETQWVGEINLGEKYESRYNKDALPYHVVTWDLDDSSDYAKSLVEEYCRDLTALSVLTKNLVEGAVVGMDVKWLLNPTSGSSATDFANARNGDVLAGIETDLTPVVAGNGQAIQVTQSVLSNVEQRVSRAFLLGSGVTRDAERVTAEEIRLQAQELETAYGGTYTTLAGNVQRPLALWLIKQSKVDIGQMKVTIVTGLEAMSRNGDLENLRLALGDLAQFSALPPELQARINFPALAAFVGAGRGVDMKKFLISEEEFQAKMQQQQQARVAEATQTAAGEAGAQAAAQQGSMQ